jgi:hypothetical protein
VHEEVPGLGLFQTYAIYAARRGLVWTPTADEAFFPRICGGGGVRRSRCCAWAGRWPGMEKARAYLLPSFNRIQAQCEKGGREDSKRECDF